MINCSSNFVRASPALPSVTRSENLCVFIFDKTVTDSVNGSDVAQSRVSGPQSSVQL